MPANNGSIKVVLFDADGVVQRPHTSWISRLQSLCGDSHQAEAFLADVFAAEQPCLSGEGDFAVALRDVLQRWRSGASVEQALAVWTLIEPQAAMLELVASLRAAGRVVGLATNQQRYRARFMAGQLGYARHFDHLLFSCDLGFAKPQQAYFSAAVAVLDVAASEVVFIDDHEANVQAARTAGLNALQFHVDEGVDALTAALAGYGVQV